MVCDIVVGDQGRIDTVEQHYIWWHITKKKYIWALQQDYQVDRMYGWPHLKTRNPYKDVALSKAFMHNDA